MFFVYYDTTKNKIGKISDEKGFLNLSPGLWTIATLLFLDSYIPSLFDKSFKIDRKSKTKTTRCSR
jgi:hypothetical protein